MTIQTVHSYISAILQCCTVFPTYINLCCTKRTHCGPHNWRTYRCASYSGNNNCGCAFLFIIIILILLYCTGALEDLNKISFDVSSICTFVHNFLGYDMHMSEVNHTTAFKQKYIKSTHYFGNSHADEHKYLVATLPTHIIPKDKNHKYNNSFHNSLEINSIYNVVNKDRIDSLNSNSNTTVKKNYVSKGDHYNNIEEKENKTTKIQQEYLETQLLEVTTSIMNEPRNETMNEIYLARVGIDLGPKKSKELSTYVSDKIPIKYSGKFLDMLMNMSTRIYEVKPYTLSIPILL